MEKPKSIFKYQGANLNSILNFKRHGLFMASPKSFNDPFDCSLHFQLDDLTEDQLNELRKQYLDSNHSEEFKIRLERNSNDTFKDILYNSAKKVLQSSIDEFLNNNGVCCFSEVNNDLLMWGHYSDSFKGFCLEFRTAYEPFSKLHKVNYLDTFPTINTFRLFSKEPSFVKELYCSKSIRWSYEKEWRVLHKQASTLFTYEPICLKAIYFGPKIEYALFEILCLILRGQNPDVELWKGELSDNAFSVTFKKINYTPYIEAKQLGLV